MSAGFSRSLLAGVLADPGRMSALALAEWDLLLRQARSSDLLPRLAQLALIHLGPGEMPTVVDPHLAAARTIDQAHRDEVRREAVALEVLLAPLGVPIVLLKGAAYLLGNGPAGLGRTVTDLDILVPREALADVESALLIGGWNTTHPHPYDQAYYRRWMHELPPMIHGRRGTALDVHHAILPPTARTGTDSTLLIEEAIPLPGHRLLRTPCAVDQVLHSMAHLLFNEELSHGLRDLSDIDLMLRHYGSASTFWPMLTDRARQLHLESTLLHGICQVNAMLRTPIPPFMLEQARPRTGPRGLYLRGLNALWECALDTHHPSVASSWGHIARGLLFLRAHAIRMPAAMLARHLTIKLGRRLVPSDIPMHA